MHIVEGGLDDPRVVDLLHTHRTRARAETAPGSAYALDPSGLRAPEMTFWSAWEGDAVVGVGALKRLSAEHGEVKSMYTAEAARGRGVGSAMLRHIMAAARARGMSRAEPRDRLVAVLRAGARPVRAPRVRGVRAVRGLPGGSEQRVHDAGASTLTWTLAPHLSRWVCTP